MITEKILKAAAGNMSFGAGLMRLLLRHRGQISVTEGVVKAAVANFEGVARLLLSRGGSRPSHSVRGTVGDTGLNLGALDETGLD